MAWDDHAAALRLASLTWVLAHTPFNSLNEQQKKSYAALTRMAFFHAQLVLKDGFFYPKHNHGMFQAVAALYFARHFPSLAKTGNLAKEASQKIADYFLYAFILPEYIKSILPLIMLACGISFNFFCQLSLQTAQSKILQTRETSWESLKYSGSILQNPMVALSLLAIPILG